MSTRRFTVSTLLSSAGFLGMIAASSALIPTRVMAVEEPAASASAPPAAAAPAAPDAASAAAPAAAPAAPPASAPAPVAAQAAPKSEVAPQSGLEELSLEELLNTSVSTVSRKAQRIEDAPGVVSVITKAEIQAMGARTLADILWTLPGFTPVQDNNERLVAVRGVFATTNQFFVILRDGHRLNEFLFENVEPDYSISLGNVRKIEIVRGPGASVYGNAATTAVINIITEDGELTEDRSIAASGGNYGQVGTEGIVRKKWDGGNLLAFGKFTTMDGQKVGIPATQDYGAAPGGAVAGTALTDRFRNSFDTGFKLTDGSLVLSGSVRRSNYAQPKGNGGQTVDQNALFHDLEQTFLYSYLDLQGSWSLGPVKVTGRHYLDYSTYESWQLSKSPSVSPPGGGLFSFAWSGYRAGLEYTGLYEYGKGDILVGASAERRVLVDSYYESNALGAVDAVSRTRTPLLPSGAEANGAVFGQIEHAILPWLKVNAGGRVDYYEDFGASLNPRAALIVSPLEGLTTKLVYARAFQAPSYFYRKSNPSLGYGSTDSLKPTIMNSFEAVVRYAPNVRWSAEVTGFQNRLSNVVAKDSTALPQPLYRNMLNLTVEGVEAEVKGRVGPVSAFANYTLQVPMESVTDAKFYVDGALKSIPRHSANAGVTYKPFSFLSANVTGLWTGRVQAPLATNPQNDIGQHVVLNGTLALEDVVKGTRFAATVYNALDDTYQLAGNAGSTGGMPPTVQAGRWFLVTGEYTF